MIDGSCAVKTTKKLELIDLCKISSNNSSITRALDIQKMYINFLTRRDYLIERFIETI